MIATFVLTQPLWLAFAFALVVAAAGTLRHARRSGPKSEPYSGRRRAARALAALLRNAGIVAFAVLIGLWLALEQTPLAHGLLAALVLLVAAWMLLEAYRQRPPNVSALRALTAATARLLAWGALAALLARPVWDWVVVDWQRPLLVVLLDHSRSMEIDDARGAGDEPRPRADAANEAFEQAQAQLRQLDELYDVRLRRLGDRYEETDAWRIVAEAPTSALAAGIRFGGEMRSSAQDPPAAVMLISDGAENVAGVEAVREAAATLAEQRTAFLAVGVGPPPGKTPLVELKPLLLPARIGLRERLRVAVLARVQGCAGHALAVELLWGNESAASKVVSVGRKNQPLRAEFDAEPPGPGPQRLTARVTLPKVLGEGVFETSSVVEVEERSIRVLLVEGPPRSESAFVARALAGDPRLDVTQRFFLRETSRIDSKMVSGDAAWSDFDVIVLGNVPKWRLTSSTLKALSEAVTRRGVGLFLTGGRDFFNSGRYGGTALADVCPIDFTNREPRDERRGRLSPTTDGEAHAMFRGVGLAENDEAEVPVGWPGTHAAWMRLPELTGAAAFGESKRLASVLARDDDGNPLLVVQEVGTGRCAAAAWESTWLWALSSDLGSVVHTRFWRQAVTWLANRRPRAWVLTDQTAYSKAALTARQQTVRIRAGVSGFGTVSMDELLGVTATLKIWKRETTTSQPASGETRPAPAMIDMTRKGDEWVAELPALSGPAGRDFPDQAGDYVLEVEFAGLETSIPKGRRFGAVSGPNGDDTLRGRTGFLVTQWDLERKAPNANLGLLRDAARITAEHGGEYYDITKLSKALAALAATDRRRRIEEPVRYDLADRNPWLILMIFVGALTVEWAVRKRVGMP